LVTRHGYVSRVITIPCEIPRVQPYTCTLPFTHHLPFSAPALCGHIVRDCTHRARPPLPSQTLPLMATRSPTPTSTPPPNPLAAAQVLCVSVANEPGLDGHILASGGGDASVRVWDIVTGLCLHTLLGHTGPVKCVCVTDQGTRVLTGGSDGRVRVWDGVTGEPVLVVTALSAGLSDVAAVGACALLPNFLVLGNAEGVVAAWRYGGAGRPAEVSPGPLSFLLLSCTNTVPLYGAAPIHVCNVGVQCLGPGMAAQAPHRCRAVRVGERGWPLCVLWR
jgi:hypothetical protein